MHPLFLSILLILPTIQIQIATLPSNQQIHHITFLKDKLFYMTKSKDIFGFISSQTGEFMTQEQVKEGEAIIRIDNQYNKMFLRKGRNQVIIFRLNTLDVHQLNFEIRFQHQRLVDVIQTEDKVYALTNKDLRGYDVDAITMGQHPNNIISSCRKKEWFLRIFLSEAESQIAIILLKGQEICLRWVNLNNKASDQKCLFNVTSQILEIYKTNQGFLIESKDLNYIITQHQKVYSFKAQLSQVTYSHALISSEFKTFNFIAEIKTQGLEVLGSTEKYQFWLKKSQQATIDIILNGKVFWGIHILQMALRCWIDAKEEDLFNLIIQLESKRMVMYELDVKNGAVRQVWGEVGSQIQDEL